MNLKDIDMTRIRVIINYKDKTHTLKTNIVGFQYFSPRTVFNLTKYYSDFNYQDGCVTMFPNLPHEQRKKLDQEDQKFISNIFPNEEFEVEVFPSYEDEKSYIFKGKMSFAQAHKSDEFEFFVENKPKINNGRRVEFWER